MMKFTFCSPTFMQEGKCGMKWKKIRELMNQTGVQKTPGCSSIDNAPHSFLAGDYSYPETTEIFMMLRQVREKLKLAG